MLGSPNRKLSLEEKFSVCNRVQKYMDENPGTNFKTACKSLNIDIGEYYNIRGYCRKVSSKATPEEFKELTKIGLEPKSVKAKYQSPKKRQKKDERLVIRPKNYRITSSPSPGIEVTRITTHPPEEEHEVASAEPVAPMPTPTPMAKPEPKVEPKIEAAPKVEARAEPKVEPRTEPKVEEPKVVVESPDYKEIEIKVSKPAYEFIERRAKLYVLSPEAVASVLLHEAIINAISRQQQQKKEGASA